MGFDHFPTFHLKSLLPGCTTQPSKSSSGCGCANIDAKGRGMKGCSRGVPGGNGEFSSSGVTGPAASSSACPSPSVSPSKFAAAPFSTSLSPGGLPLSSSSGESLRNFFPLVSGSVLSSLPFRFRDLPSRAATRCRELGVRMAPPASGESTPVDAAFKNGLGGH